MLNIAYIFNIIPACVITREGLKKSLFSDIKCSLGSLILKLK